MYRRQFFRAVSCAFPAIGGLTPRVSAAQTAYEPLVSVQILGATEAVVSPGAETPYVANQNGFAVVNVSPPGSPSVIEHRTGLLAEREGGPLQKVLDVKIAGKRLLVAGPANGHKEPVVEGFLLYDLNDPRNPEQIAFHETEFPFTRLHSPTNGHTSSTAPKSSSLTSPTHRPRLAGGRRVTPTRRERTSTGYSASLTTCMRRATACTSLSETQARSYSTSGDPESPTVVTRIGGRSPETLASIPDEDVVLHSLSMPGNHHTVAVNDDRSLLVLNKEVWESELTEPEDVDPLGEVELWDLSNEPPPEHLSTIEAPASTAAEILAQHDATQLRHRRRPTLHLVVRRRENSRRE
jgi:hypothetical protein